jgi:uncharacterized short protein YbdD (DUF466 family)
MRITEICESTTSGSVATVAAPMNGGPMKRSAVGKGVYSGKKVGNLFTGKKTSKPFVNSLKESEEVHVIYINGKPATKSTTEKDAQEQISIMRKEHPDRKYEIKKEVHEAQRLKESEQVYVVYINGKPVTKSVNIKDAQDQVTIMQNKHPNSKCEIKKEVHEARLEEDELILVPGQGRRLKTGFHSFDPDKSDREGETLKNSLRTIARNAKELHNRLENSDHFPEWVSEKIGQIKGMMTGVTEYLISAQENNNAHEGVIAGGGVGESHSHRISDTNTNVNQTGGFITSEHDDAYQQIKEFAPNLYYYIRNEAPVPLDPILTLQLLIRMRGDEDAVLRQIKTFIARDTKVMYGDDYPSFTAESLKRFWNKMLNEAQLYNKNYRRLRNR